MVSAPLEFEGWVGLQASSLATKKPSNRKNSFHGKCSRKASLKKMRHTLPDTCFCASRCAVVGLRFAARPRSKTFWNVSGTKLSQNASHISCSKAPWTMVVDQANMARCYFFRRSEAWDKLVEMGYNIREVVAKAPPSKCLEPSAPPCLHFKLSFWTHQHARQFLQLRRGEFQLVLCGWCLRRSAAAVANLSCQDRGRRAESLGIETRWTNNLWLLLRRLSPPCVCLSRAARRVTRRRLSIQTARWRSGLFLGGTIDSLHWTDGATWAEVRFKQPGAATWALRRFSLGRISWAELLDPESR